MKRLSLIVTILILACCGMAQHPKKAVKAYELAEKAFYDRNYKKAQQQVLKAIAEDPNYAEAWLLEGEIGMETGDLDLAILGYENAFSSDSLLFPPAAITLARLYDQKGVYKREITLLKWYQSKKFNVEPNETVVTDMLAKAIFRDWAYSNPVAFSPESLGVTINTADDEYVNMLSFDGLQLLLTRKTMMTYGIQKESLMVSRWDGQRWMESQPLAIKDFPDDLDLGAAFISADGRKLYMTGCGWTRDSSCDLYVSEWFDGSWLMPQPMKGAINTISWESQPCVSSDGRELYFVSRRNGNADLYCCLRNNDGTWGDPQNLGTPINTNGTEMAPFLHPDGRTLYFSSDQHVGLGGFDVFLSRRNADGSWQPPVNLGFPVNTNGDEINFFVAADGKTAFISSIREGGLGGYDIYVFELDEAFRSDSANYLSALDVVELVPGDAVVLQNIHFEYNSASLTADSEEGIRILTEFLERNPELKVELAGHTDDVGSASYNLKLSSDRAEVVRQALVDKGIEASRLTAKGYGATQPLVPNDSEEHRAMNRRTEMVVK